MKRLLLLWLLIFTPAIFFAQERKITGQLVDRDTKEAVMQVTLQLLKTDSTFVSGTISDDNGLFSLQAPQNGRYLLKISSVGYTTMFKNIEIAENKDLAMGKITMGSDAVMLKGATVTSQALKVTVKEDTFIYNSAAYRTPEGSVVEELVKRLPGAQVDDDGKITINGKEVKKVLVDGKEFMTGDTKTAMKNLPTSIINKIKVYDEKSDLSRVTGIDDGEEQTVLDFGIKPGMNKGLLSNTDLGIGTKDRYSFRSMGAWFTDDYRVMLFANANNTNDRGFPGGGGRGNFGRGRDGLSASKMIGPQFNYEKKGVLKAEGSVRWNHNDGDALTKTSTENFVTTTGSFSNSINQNYSRSDQWEAQGRLEWTPDTLTNIMFRPSASISKQDSRSASTSASYNDDPYLYVTDPLSAEAISQMADDSLMVNARENKSISYSDSKKIGGTIQFNRKLNSMGRNVTLRASANYSDSESKSLSTSNVHLYQVQNAWGADSTYQTNRYNITPTKNWNYQLQTTYSEPLWRATFLQFSYKFKYSYSKSERSTYDFSNLGEDFFSSVPTLYRGWNQYLNLLENPYTSYLDSDLSRYSEYKNYTHEIEVMFRMIRNKYNFNVGVMLQPQKSHFIQEYQGVHTDTMRTVTNITPTLDFRYRFSKVSSLRINYRGTSSQPSMTQLLDITDDSDPLNISKGNPGLKPSFTNSLRFFYNGYLQSHYRTWMAFLDMRTTRNSISNMVTYDETTGGRTTQPQNINGNWNLNSAIMYNMAIDTLGNWNVNTSTDFRYANSVGFITLDQTSSSMKNYTRTTTIGERLAGSYRNDWLEVELDGSLNYTHSRNKLLSNNNLDTWQFAYGVSINATMPWGSTVSTDLHENSRRGYNDQSMNTNELVWNAQVAHSFLKGKSLTISLQLYDILHQQSNFSRTIDAMRRSDTEYNAINSYAMIHAIYRFNLFGGTDNHRMGPPDGPGGDGPRGDRPRGGRDRRGFGGGRPPGGGFGGPR